MKLPLSDRLNVVDDWMSAIADPYFRIRYPCVWQDCDPQTLINLSRTIFVKYMKTQETEPEDLFRYMVVSYVLSCKWLMDDCVGVPAMKYAAVLLGNITPDQAKRIELELLNAIGWRLDALVCEDGDDNDEIS